MARPSALGRPRLDSLRSNNSSIANSQWGARPASPAMSQTTNASHLDFTHPPAVLITRNDLRKSIQALEELMIAAKAYRTCLLALSKTTSAFAQALESCSRLKGCDAANAGLMGAGGWQHMVGNHEQLMADTFYRNFEIPLLETLDNYRASVTDRQATYEKQCHEKSSLIKKTESENIKHGRRRKRDLQQFRQALSMLQAQVDELDNLKSTYHHEVMEAEDELWSVVLGKVAFVVRAQLEVYEKVSAKGTDPALEPLVSSIPDPFDSYGPPKDDGLIFSVLSPLGLMTSTPKPPTRPHTPGDTSPTQPHVQASGSRTPTPTDKLIPSESEAALGMFGDAPTSIFTNGLKKSIAPEYEPLEADDALDHERQRRELSIIEDRSEVGSVTTAKAMEDHEPVEVLDSSVSVDGAEADNEAEPESEVEGHHIPQPIHVEAVEKDDLTDGELADAEGDGDDKPKHSTENSISFPTSDHEG